MMRRAFETVAIDRLDRIGKTRLPLILLCCLIDGISCLSLCPVVLSCHLFAFFPHPSIVSAILCRMTCMLSFDFNSVFVLINHERNNVL